MHRYRHKKIGGLVNSSSTVNTSQLTGTPNGTVELTTGSPYYLNKMSFHHLRFPVCNNSLVFAKTKSDAAKVELLLSCQSVSLHPQARNVIYNTRFGSTRVSRHYLSSATSIRAIPTTTYAFQLYRHPYT